METTPDITFKNLEVLDAWIHRRENLYKGSMLRKAWLSEAGVASGMEYNAVNFKNQAASTAYAWKKLNRLEGIEGLQWHNWFDNRAEGDLRIGLRKYNDKIYMAEPKPVFYTYKNCGTDNEDEYFKKKGYLKIIGISNWDSIFHQVK